MIIDIDEFDGDKLTFDYTSGSLLSSDDLDGFRLTEPARIQCSAELADGRLLITGSITANSEFDCTRCLEPISRLLEVPFSAAFVSDQSLYSQAEAELGEADLDLDELLNGKIELNDLAREQILLNLPEQIYCRDDCKGICEQCGTNLNLITCKCKNDDIDPRWAMLKDLK